MGIQFNKESTNDNMQSEKERANMSVTLEQIDLIMKRTSATYIQAKEALERANGDVVEAIATIEREGNAGYKRGNYKAAEEKFNTCVETLNQNHFILSKNGHDYIHAPLIAVLIAMLLCFHISILALLIALICGFRFQITDKVTHKVHFSNDHFKSSDR